MNSRSSELHKNIGDKVKQNKTYDFINFYKPASETNVRLLEKRKSDDGSSKENNTTNARSSPHKKKKKPKRDSINTTQVAEELNVPSTSEILNESKVTSTPNVKNKKNKNVKSIMKTSLTDDSLEVSTITIPSKPKKRNKSVSFILDENEEVVVKKSKSDDCLNKSKIESKDVKNKIHKKKNNIDNGNVNSRIDNSEKSEIDKAENFTKPKTKDQTQSDETNVSVPQTVDTETKKHKKHKKKATEVQEVVIDEEIDSTNTNVTNKKVKKLKKKKNNSEESEMAKEEIKPEVIAQDLENLNIGDNPHKLTDLLEMTVIDKNKRKKNKKKKDLKTDDTSNQTESVEAATAEEKEKVKWNKRKWNKDKKGLLNDVSTTVIIENLPLKIMCNYRKLLTDHFGRFGQIKQVGAAELYSIEDPETFTTTICLDSEDAVEKALQEDNTLFEESRIRVKRQLPPTQTTLVVKSYGALPEPALSSLFAEAGRIRSIKRLVKGKNSRNAVFIEFDGPEAVERAIKVADGVRLERKKIFACKYIIRNKKYNKAIMKNDDNDVSDASEE